MTQLPAIAPSPPVMLARPARILVVDDEPAMCAFCERALTTVGYDVITACEIASDLSQMRVEPPIDLLLCDIMMPGMSGLDVARRARELDPAIAIIIMTGHASFENLRESVRRGVTDFLSKPFELDTLRLAVDRALHTRQLLQDNIRLQALAQLQESSKAISALLDQHQLCTVLLERAMQHVSCQAGFLLLHDCQQELALAVVNPPGWSLLPDGFAAARTAFTQAAPTLLEDSTPLCRDDTSTVCRALLLPIHAHGKPTGLLLIADERVGSLSPGDQHILSLLVNHAGTALHNAQLYGELQQAYEALREVDRLKSEFVAIASHELRTPLSIVLGYATMVREQSSGDVRDYTDHVLDSAQRIKTIVDDMMRLHHLDRKETDLALELCPLSPLVEQAAARAQHEATAKKQQLCATLPPEPITLLGDHEKIDLVVNNLIANALKFTPSGGTISVTLSNWSRDRVLAATRKAVVNPTFRNVAALAANEWAVIEVRDTGIGIPRHEQARIFERFYQVADSLTREHGGTGLGLALVGELSELQGGIVWLESEEQQGSTFYFALPHRAAQRRAVSRTNSESAP